MSDLGSETTMLRVVHETMNHGKHMKNKVWEETSSRSQNDRHGLVHSRDRSMDNMWGGKVVCDS